MARTAALLRAQEREWEIPKSGACSRVKMCEFDVWEANTDPEGVVWEVYGTIFTGEHPGAPGARDVDFLEVLAILVAQGVVQRHRQG